MADGPNIRTCYLPIEHLEAELVAAPLSSFAGFQYSLTALDPALKSRDTRELWREVETSLLSRFPGLSIDELIARRDRTWFDGTRGRATPLFNVLNSATTRIIDAQGKVGQPRFNRTGVSREFEAKLPPDELRRLWRWLTFALPPDLLLAVAGVDTESPTTLSPNLAHKLAAGGYAEPHLHIGAAIPFEVLWSATQYELAQTSAEATMFFSPGAEFNEGRDLAPWLLRAAICRPLLAAFLTSRRRGAGFSAFLATIRPRVTHLIGIIGAHRMQMSVMELWNGQFSKRSPTFELLRDDFASLTSFPLDFSALLQLSDFRRLDPLNEWYPDRYRQSPDFQFTRAALKYLSTDAAPDALFVKLFWQVIRLRVAFYRHVVQRPMTPGLQWFLRTFSRLKPGKRNVVIEALLESVVANANLGFRSLEFRTGPMGCLSELTDFVRRVDSAAQRLRTAPATKNLAPLEVGIVFHFSRTRGSGARAGVPAAWSDASHASPRSQSNPSGYRYSGFYIENRTNAAALANLVTTFPRTLEIVRGVDLCSDELGVPLWAMRGLIEHVVKAADKSVRLIPECRVSLERPMRVTVHAGEDYVHLLGGIRRVGEAIEFIPLSEGDRIGHAVALGVEPLGWARLVQTVPITLEERLLDLTWVWRLAMRGNTLPELKNWIPWLREQLDYLAHRIFGDVRPSSPAALSAFQCALHDTRYLRLVGFPSGPRPTAELPDTAHFILRWLTDPNLFQRAQELDNIDVRNEAALTLAAQRQVRLDIGRLGITIEVNPSSNLLIGHLGRLEEHPLWRLRPPRGSDKNTPPVRICLGSDDPITFATTLANEYQLVFDAMTESGLSADECDCWIENVRQTSLESRFTIPRSDRDLMLPFSLASSPLLL